MRIKIEIDKNGNCSKRCPFLPQNEGGIPIMVGGGLCVSFCDHYNGYLKDLETQEIIIECDFIN